MSVKVASTRAPSGRLLHVTFWAGPGRANRWQSRASTLAQKLPELTAWLAQHVPDPTEFLARRLPELGPLLADALFAPPPEHRWVYGRIAVVRAENGRFTCALDIHGGTRTLPGSWPTPETAAAHCRRAGAERVVFLGPGENAGDCSRGQPDGWRSDKFSALVGARPLS